MILSLDIRALMSDLILLITDEEKEGIIATVENLHFSMQRENQGSFSKIFDSKAGCQLFHISYLNSESVYQSRHKYLKHFRDDEN